MALENSLGVYSLVPNLYVYAQGLYLCFSSNLLVLVVRWTKRTKQWNLPEWRVTLVVFRLLSLGSSKRPALCFVALHYLFDRLNLAQRIAYVARTRFRSDASNALCDAQ